MTKISIITINYNDAVGLEKTVQSVVNQSCKDFEYIVIDGGSTDGSKDVIEKYKNQITYWISEKDSGIYNAMNKGIVKATGEYLLFINSGDILHNDLVVEKLYLKIDLNYTFISGSLLFLDENNKTHLKEHPEVLTLKYMMSRTLSHPSTLIKKEAFNKYGLYNENNKIISDWEFFFKSIALNGESYKKIDLIISQFNLDGISSKQKDLGCLEIKNSLTNLLPYVYNNENDTFIFNSLRVTNRRVVFLQKIEKNILIRKVTTVILYLLSKLS